MASEKHSNYYEALGDIERELEPHAAELQAARQRCAACSPRRPQLT